MTDALTKLRQKKANRNAEPARRAAIIEEAIGNYAKAADKKASLERSVKFAVSDIAVRQMLLSDIDLLWDAINECVPCQIRTEYGARQSTRHEEIIEKVM